MATLVTGATGTVGSAVVDELVARGATPRVAVRRPAAARERWGSDVAAVEFDFERPETWGGALDGVSRAFLVRPPGVGVDRMREAVDALARVGVERLAYLSVLGADRNPLLPHRRIERRVESSGVPYTFLRASFFMQNLVEVHRVDLVERGELFVPAGEGETSFVDARDVGAVGAAALTEPGHAYRAYDLTGPAALTYEEVAAALSAELDRDVRYPAPSVVAFVRRWLGRDAPLPFVFVMVGIYTTARLGLAGRVTDDVARVLGRPPRDLRTFAADYRGAFASGDAQESPDGSDGGASGLAGRSDDGSGSL
ncbi:SDR family oxidoreductase [Halostella litorea]|uniref:SDR family oxidoreductase n=1 Tax=Halostella litorea TaxID=2528831 RepID=UPI00192A5422|nr:SDR family oxidoreductase [Halostella litorea]